MYGYLIKSVKSNSKTIFILFLFLSSVIFLPPKSLAENLIIFKGKNLSEDILSGLITIPYLEIQVASWGLAYSDDDLLIFEPSFRTVTLYDDTIISTLPDPDDIITLTDGTTDSLTNILDNELYVIFETDIGIATTDILEHFASTVPILPTGNGGGGGGGGGTQDNCPSDPNKTQPGICGCGTPDTDSDMDGSEDCIDMDDDNDGMPDVWEVQYGLKPLVNDAEIDTDGDGFSNLMEYNRGTIPNDAESYPPQSMPWLPLLLED